MGAGVAGVSAGLTATGCAPKTTDEKASSSAAQDASEGKIGLQTLQTNENPNFYPPVEGEIAFVADKIDDKDIVETIECDLVVCGGGFAGLCTATSAAEEGLNVIVLEKNQTCDTRGSDIGVLNGKFVESCGGSFDEKQYYQDALRSAQYRCNPLIWQKWIDNCGIAVDWMLDTLGDSITPSLNLAADGSGTYSTNGITTYRDQLNIKEGMPALADILQAKAEEFGAQFLFSTPAAQLIQEENGNITGVIAKGESGYIKVVAAKGVALCTGGYENNWEMLRENIQQGDLVNGSWRLPITNNTGDGHMMGLAVNATIDGYPHVTMRVPGGAMKSHVADVCRALGLLSWPRVNEAGERFVNESLAVNYKANAIAQQPNGHCWCLIPAPVSIEESILSTGYQNGSGSICKKSPEQVAELLSQDWDIYNSLEELAAGTGINEQNLKATIARLQELHDLGEDVDWGNDPGYLFDWSAGPYYAIEESGSVLVTVSGLRITPKSEVIDSSGMPINGLYAVGNASGSMFACTYPHELSGISHGRCLTFGYLLGKRLAGKEVD